MQTATPINLNDIDWNDYSFHYRRLAHFPKWLVPMVFMTSFVAVLFMSFFAGSFFPGHSELVARFYWSDKGAWQWMFAHYAGYLFLVMIPIFSPYFYLVHFKKLPDVAIGPKGYLHINPNLSLFNLKHPYRLTPWDKVVRTEVEAMQNLTYNLTLRLHGQGDASIVHNYTEEKYLKEALQLIQTYAPAAVK